MGISSNLAPKSRDNISIAAIVPIAGTLEISKFTNHLPHDMTAFRNRFYW